MIVKTSLLSAAAGSAYVELPRGGTKVMCSVRGPHAPTVRVASDGVAEQRSVAEAVRAEMSGALECDVEVAPFALPPSSKLGSLADAEVGKRRSSTKSVELTAAVRTAITSTIVLSAFPKAAVSVHVLVLQDGGSVQSAAITCASLALADAGLELFDLVAGCSVAVLPSGSLAVLPTRDEEKDAVAVIGAAKTMSAGELSHLSISGNLGVESTGEALTSCVDACDGVLLEMKKALLCTMG